MLISNGTLRRTGRATAAGLLVLIGLLLSACSARGSGELSKGPVDGIPVEFLGRAYFSFDLTCGIVNGKPKIGGKIRYRDEGPAVSTDLLNFPVFGSVVFEGTLSEITILDENNQEIEYNPETCEAYEMMNIAPNQLAQFVGTYKAGHKEGIFNLFVFEDEGSEPNPALELTGDYFSIELASGPYTGYTRAGYIECGVIEVRDEANN